MFLVLLAMVYARCLLLLILRSCVFIQGWLYRSLLGLFSWYVCGHYIHDDVLEIIPHCVDITELGDLKFSEVISEAFLDSLHIGFSPEVDGSILVSFVLLF